MHIYLDYFGYQQLQQLIYHFNLLFHKATLNLYIKKL